MESDENEHTPVDIALRRPGSVEARSVADLGLALAAIAVDIGQIAGKLDKAEGAERAGILAGLANQLGQIGDACHDARRVVSGL